MKNKLKVLIIDDNPNDRLMVIRELKKEFELVSTEIINQHDFDLAISSIDFDIAITDYQLLWTDGLKVLKEIKTQHPATPVIMYTGTGNEEVAVEAMKNGLDDYIIKSSRQIFRLPHAVNTLIGSVIEKQKRIRAERKYEILVKNLVIGVVQLDLDFNILVANKTQLNFFRINDENVIGKKCHDVFTELNCILCENCPGKQVKASKNKIVTDPIKFYTNGDETWLQLTYFPSYDEFQEIDGFIVLTEDVSSIINARREIVESEEKYRTMVELAPDSIFTIDLQGNINSCNSSFYKFSGYEESEIAGKNFRDLKFISGEKMDEIEKIFGFIMAGQTPELIEVEWKTKDGRIIFSEVHASISYKDNKISGIQVISRDITERIKAETLKSVIFNIAIAVNITEELNELFDIIRLELSKVIKTNNFYIALFDENSNDLELSYYKDINNHFEEFPSLKTLAHYLLEVNSALLLNEEEINELINKEIVEDSSAVPKSWLGIPLKIKQQTIGLMVVRDYEKENAFVQEDKMIFEYVSHQVAVSIQRKQDFEQLKIAKLAAEESDRLKTAFLHNISHEIRTPMNAIIGFSELLNNPSLLPEKRNQFTDTITKSSYQLLSIISDIINIATLESGQEKIVEKEIDLNSILGSLYEQFQLNVNTQNVRFTLNNTLDDNGFCIVTDDIKLVQVLTNLISNAIKFTVKGSINYGYQLKGNELEFFVEDTGIGISPELHHIIFDRFRQVEGTAQQFGGSGLGLSISKGYVELMGGKMWLTSDLGKGTTFFFTIPYKNEEYKTSSSKPHLENGLQPIIKASKTILVAEDEDSNFMLIEEFLSELNANIIRVVNGIEAVNICKSKKDIDLILMDIKMPLMNGDEATKQIKAFMPNIPIIAQTAYSTVAEKEKILTYGCDDFISKPLKREVLISKIKEQLNKE